MASLASTCRTHLRTALVTSCHRTSNLHYLILKANKAKFLSNIMQQKSKCVSNRNIMSEASQSIPIVNDSHITAKKAKKSVSPAMKIYLEKKTQHDAFIAKERSEFELGKKHLANMMGMDYETMTQEDVDKAIEYLFPSGLYNPDARPKMKPPEEVCRPFDNL